MHGNELVGGMVLDRLAGHAPEHLVAGGVLEVRVNLAAHEADRRHTASGTDMNRLWDRDTLDRLATTPEADLCYEERRVRELAPLLLACDAVLDLHSTSRPAPPFLLYRDDQRHALLAARLGVKRLVTGVHEGGVLEGGLAMTVGLRAGERSPRLGFTFEAGQHSNPANPERAWAVTLRLLHALGLWDEAPPLPTGEPEVYEVMDRFAQAPRGAEPWRFAGWGDDAAPTGRRGPPRALVSFERVEPDEVILRRGDRVVRAQAPFTMLMPAPTADAGADLYFVTQPRHGGLGLRERTDADARLQAEAIERVLDLTDDDELAAGMTWVGFEDRLLLDLVADTASRAVRLPEGHPHRRITVVGRGDFGGGEGERRAGQRYRRAMREALLAGLPVERLQLLRGASLGWIDRMTSPAMARRLGMRRARSGREGIDLYLSARQPHTLSLLVVGDMDRALRDGDTRFVRVALVVEASAVTRTGAEVGVRVVRAGLVSGRAEVIRAAWRLRAALRAEHQALMRRYGHLDPGLPADPERPLVPSEDPARMAAVRSALRRVQLHLWREALGSEHLRARDLDAEGVAEWVASTAVRTGIRDLDALRALLVEETPGRWRVEPEILQAACEDPTGFAPTPPAPGHGPVQPLTAADVGADDLERWVGWKRFLRRAQPVPHTRGKDLDLALTGADIHRRVEALYRRARELARHRPGRVLLVVAGDGQSPLRSGPGTRGSLEAHEAVLGDPDVRYLRIQHLPGTHLSWLKDLLQRVAARPAGAAPAQMALEEEHGALISVVLLAVRDEDAPEDAWTLDGWRLEAAGVLLTELEVAARGYALGLFTEPLPGEPERVNLDLLHFARSHCQELLDQARVRARVDEGAGRATVREAVVEHLAEWAALVRGATLPDDPEARRDRVADDLGLADPHLAAALAAARESTRDPREVAVGLWDAVVPWPGE